MERAQSYTVHPDGSAPSADELRGARVILDQVLPAYEAAKKPALPIEKASGKTVDVTWYAGPTLETSPTQQVCWYRKLLQNIPDE